MRVSGRPSAYTPLADHLDVDFEVVDVKVKLTPHWVKKSEAEQLSSHELNLSIEMFNNVVEEVRFILRRV